MEQAMINRAYWKEAGYEEQYLDGYYCNTDWTYYPDGSGAQDAWQAGYDDRMEDARTGRYINPE